MIFDKNFFDSLLKQAEVNPRFRQNFDLRTTDTDTSQRMLNALLPGTEIPIHRHEDTSETVVILCGKLEVILYERNEDGSFQEMVRHLLCPTEGKYGIQISKGEWHTIRVFESSVIFEAKDGAYKPS